MQVLGQGLIYVGHDCLADGLLLQRVGVFRDLITRQVEIESFSTLLNPKEHGRLDLDCITSHANNPKSGHKETSKPTEPLDALQPVDPKALDSSPGHGEGGELARLPIDTHYVPAEMVVILVGNGLQMLGRGRDRERVAGLDQPAVGAGEKLGQGGLGVELDGA